MIGSFLTPVSNHTLITDPKTAPPIEYGSKFYMHLIRIWNLRISHPHEDIFLWDDDVAGAFRQGKYNPEIACAFSFIIFGTLWLPCGMVLGGNTSPQCYEPLANAREHLARHLSSAEFDSLIEKHWDILQHVKFDAENVRKGSRSQAFSCKKYKGVFNLKTYKRANTPHYTFVDDNHMAELRKFILQAMAASIESLYRIFSFPMETLRLVPLSMDKYYHATCSTRKEQLGLIVDTHLMIVELPETKRAKILEKIAHWHSGRKSFTVLQAAQLLGILEHAATIAPWLKYMFDCLRHSLLQALRKKHKQIIQEQTPRRISYSSLLQRFLS